MIISSLFFTLLLHADISAILDRASWAFGRNSSNCQADPSVPSLQSLTVDRDLVVLRQTGASSSEAPFLYLIFGEEKAVLIDTGDDHSEHDGYQRIPLSKTVLEQIKERYGNRKVHLTVLHSHAHGDHVANDGQFESLQSPQQIKGPIKVAPLEVDRLKTFLNIPTWPQGHGEIQLGDRNLTVLPIPGHEASSIAVYDPKLQTLFTGDTFYPGFLFVNCRNFPDFFKSIEKMYEFTQNHPVKHLLGGHVESKSTPSETYAYGTACQPLERRLELKVSDLKKLYEGLKQMRYSPHSRDFGAFQIRISGSCQAPAEHSGTQ